jgi:K+-sensing histidine kinase KdpD
MADQQTLPRTRRRSRRSDHCARTPGDQIGLPEKFDPDAFLGVLSHELRTPVTTIYGGAQILATRDLPDARRRALAVDVSQEAERLFRIVEDLVMLMRSERGDVKPAREPVAVGRLIAGAIEHELARNPARRIRYLGASDAAVDEADEALLIHAVRNLLDNGIRYSADGDSIEVVVEPEGDEIAVRFLDRGHTTNQLARRDAINPAATQAGMAGGGLGLFVAARLIQAMGGRSWAVPRTGGGAEFGFALQRSAVPRGGDQSVSSSNVARSVFTADSET